MSTTQINTGILAYGMSGKVFHAPFVHAHPGFRLKGVLERTKKTAQNDYPYTTSYSNIEELMGERDIELVIVNTPNYTHFEYAELALKAGKHVLVEKPFTTTVSEAKTLFRLADTVGKKVLFYQNRRYDSGFNAVRRVIETGRLGKLIEVHFRFDRYRAGIGKKLFKEEPIAAAGISYDLGAHLIDQAIALFGKPLKYNKTLGKNRIDTRVDDYFHCHLHYEGLLNVFLTANTLVADIPPAFVVYGREGAFQKNHSDVQEAQLQSGIKPTDKLYGIESEADKGKLTLVNPNGEKEVSYLESPKGDYMQIFEAVYQTLVHDKPFPIKADDILWQLEILES